MTAALATCWISRLKNTRDAKAIRVTFGNEVFDGVSYQCDRNFGDKGREPKWETRLYLLGFLPKAYADHTVYVLDGQEWYIAGYWCQGASLDRTGAIDENHPFGRHFYLHCWNVPSGEKIDAHERKPRPRLTITVEDL